MKQPSRKGRQKKNAQNSNNKNKSNPVGKFNQQPEKIIEETFLQSQTQTKEVDTQKPQDAKKQEQQSESSSFMSDFDD